MATSETRGEQKPRLFAYSLLLPLLWIIISLGLTGVPSERRVGIVETAVVVGGVAMLVSWLFVRRHRRHFANHERWRLIGYCAIWAAAWESMELISASVGLSRVTALTYGVLFAIPFYALIIWGDFTVSGRRIIDSYLQKQANGAA